jgi:hypothetical protein
MMITQIIKVATTEFETKMLELGKNLDTRQLTRKLAGQVSRALEDAMASAGRVAFKTFIERYDVSEPSLDVNGQTIRFKGRFAKEFLTRFGPIDIQRGLYQADRGGSAYVPLDVFWEMQGHYAVVDVREAICFAMAHMTADETAQLFDMCSLFKPSSQAVKNVVKKVQRDVEPHLEQLDQAVRDQIEPSSETKVFVVSMDGVNVLLREPGSRQRRPSERPGTELDTKKESTYKNAMVGTISLYGDVVDPQKNPCPERLATFSTARMPEERAVTFKEQFDTQVADMENKIAPEVTKVILCDAHPVLWNYIDQHDRFDGYEKLVDFYHTEEHLSKAAEALFGKKSDKARQWYTTYGAKLLEQEDGALSVIRSMMYYRNTLRLSKNRQDKLSKEQTFFRRNKYRMTYADFRCRGLPIGSGPVEAACKSLVKTRLCRSGMRWSREGGQRILNLRCYAKSGLWNEFWNTYMSLKRAS